MMSSTDHCKRRRLRPTSTDTSHCTANEFSSKLDFSSKLLNSLLMYFSSDCRNNASLFLDSVWNAAPLISAQSPRWLERWDTRSVRKTELHALWISLVARASRCGIHRFQLLATHLGCTAKISNNLIASTKNDSLRNFLIQLYFYSPAKLWQLSEWACNSVPSRSAESVWLQCCCVRRSVHNSGTFPPS